MVYILSVLLNLSLVYTANAAVCEGQDCQIVLFDDFNGPTPDEDPICYTQFPNCSPRPEWGDTGKCKELNSSILSKTYQLNKCRWKLWQGYAVHGREKTYRWDPNMVEVSNGLLTLSAQPSKDNVQIDDPSCTHSDGIAKCAYVSGGIDSRPSFGGEHAGFDFRYGKVEIRARFEMGPGAFPALWMFGSATRPEEKRPVTDNDRKYQEIDILEIFPDVPFTWRDPWTFWVENMSAVRSVMHQTLHWGVNETDKSLITDSQVLYHGDFHTYTVEWEPSKIVFSIDGKTTETITEKDKKGSRKVKIPDLEMFLIFNLQLSRGKYLVNYFKKNVLQNDVSQLKNPIKMQLDWVKVTSKKKNLTSIIPFPHPPLVKGVNYSVKIIESKPRIRYPLPCIWGGTSVGNECELMILNSTPLPPLNSYIVKTELTDSGPGVYYVTNFIRQKTCPHGGAFIKTVGGEYSSYTGKSLYKNLCRLHLIKPSGPVLVPGVSYSVLAPESKRGFGIYYPQSSNGNVCPWGGRAMDLHDYYDHWWWIPTCQVMELDRNQIDPLRSLEIIMDSNPAKRSIRYRNDY